MLFHMIGAVSGYGKIGLTVIADSPGQVDALYDHAIEAPTGRPCTRSRDGAGRISRPSPKSRSDPGKLRHTIDMVSLARDIG